MAQREISWLSKGWNRLLRAIKKLAVQAGFIEHSSGPAEVIQAVERIAAAFERGQRARARDFNKDIRGTNLDNQDIPAFSRTAAQPAAALGNTPEFWLNIQHAVELWDVRHRAYEHEAKNVKPVQPHVLPMKQA